jgi:hypothetical protein
VILDRIEADDRGPGDHARSQSSIAKPLRGQHDNAASHRNVEDEYTQECSGPSYRAEIAGEQQATRTCFYTQFSTVVREAADSAAAAARIPINWGQDFLTSTVREVSIILAVPPGRFRIRCRQSKSSVVPTGCHLMCQPSRLVALTLSRQIHPARASARPCRSRSSACCLRSLKCCRCRTSCGRRGRRR